MTLADIVTAVLDTSMREGIPLVEGKPVRIEIEFDGQEWALSHVKTSVNENGEIVAAIVA